MKKSSSRKQVPGAKNVEACGFKEHHTESTFTIASPSGGCTQAVRELTHSSININNSHVNTTTITCLISWAIRPII